MEVTQGEGWLAAPSRARRRQVLLISPYQSMGLRQVTAITSCCEADCKLRSPLHVISAQPQLETLLELCMRWQRNSDLSELLHSVAQVAARMLNGDRASIFLWDRPRGELVGYPALGVEGDTLRIRDDQGIAATVLRSSQPRRWDQTQDAAAINARVGEKLGYATTSLVAVPLLDQKSRPLGVFEVINHRQGEFSSEDEALLVELARYAAAAVENMQRIASLIQSRDRLVKSASDSAMLVGQCPQIVALRDTLERVAATELAVLILGENGTGKEVVARSLHLQSPRRDQPFVAVNCAAIAETLIESELFGHAKGAFTDAVSDRAGKFELASGGTLLLDEIGELSLSGQAKLLRVLEDKVVTRVGSERPIQTDVRIIAASPIRTW